MSKGVAFMASEKRLCPKCGKEKSVKSAFYYSHSSMNTATNQMTICKSCLKDIYAEQLGKTRDVKQAIYNTCMLLDVYFDDGMLETAKEKGADGVLQAYLTPINSLSQYKGLSFLDSPCFAINKSGASKSLEDLLDTEPVPEEFQDKWGTGFTMQEVRMLEKAENELSADKNTKFNSAKQYVRIAAMHLVRHNLALQNGNATEAEKYFKAYDAAMKSGELTPSALAKNNTTDKLGSFSEFSLMTEECTDLSDVFNILPKYVERPKDKVDIAIWFQQNYLEKTAGKPISKYRDIYSFYDTWIKDANVSKTTMDTAYEDAIDNMESHYTLEE